MGLVFLGSMLVNQGHEVLLHDSRVDDNSLETAVLTFHPEYVGMSVVTGSRTNAFRLCKVIKTIDPRVKVLLGGPHFTPLSARQAVELYGDRIDFCVLGYGERALSQLISGEDPHSISGLVFQHQKTIVETSFHRRASSEDLVVPDYSLLHLKKYKLRIQSMASLPLFTSRGCPNKCIFCAAGAFSRNIVFFPVDLVKRTIDAIYSLGYRAITVQDDSFGLDRKKAYEVLEYLASKGIAYSIKSRIEVLEDDYLLALKNTGCCGVKFGVESVVPHVVERLNKSIRLDRLEHVLQTGSRLKLRMGAYFLVGNPGESYQDAMKTIRFTGQLLHRGVDPLIAIGCFIFPGTALEEISKEEGVIGREFNWAQEFSDERNTSIGYDRSVPVYISNEIGYQELVALQREYAKETNSRFALGIKRLLPDIMVAPLRSIYHRFVKQTY
ncbi:radical SAM protein [bacterium]|nr:MAG: radical SAM protein [bacterium]